MNAPTCARGNCRRLTLDPSGFCQDHRKPGVEDSTKHMRNPPPPQPSSAVPSDDGGVWVHMGGVRMLTFRDEDDLLHRTDGPAITGYRTNGTKTTETWSLHGLEHRTGGPAITWFSDRGLRSKVAYRVNDRTSRIDGPAVIFYKPDGTVSDEYYAISSSMIEIEWRPGLTRSEEAAETRALIARRALELTAEDLRSLIEASEIYVELTAEGHDPEKIHALYRTGLEAGLSSGESIRALAEGSPVEWVRAYEDGRS